MSSSRDIAPYHQQYAKDFLAETVGLTLEEIGAYALLREVFWVEGAIKVDAIERRYRVSVQVWDSIRHLFREENGLVLHDNLSKQKKDFTDKHEERSASGKKGAQSKWKDGSAISSANGSAAIRAYGSVYGSASDVDSLSLKSAEKLSLPKTRADFSEWIRPWPRVPNADAAARAWLSVDVKSTEAAFACRDRYLASDEVARNVVMDPARFIFEQAKNGWSGKWPVRIEPQPTKDKSFMASVERTIGPRLAKGEKPW